MMPRALPRLHLVLFFTRNVSLRTWAQNGSLEREIALYVRLQAKGVKVSFVTYGDKKDLIYAKNLQGIEILCNHWNLPPRWYERLLPYLYARSIQRADVIKTNQTNGAGIALRVAQKWHKPLIARCGYMWSDFAIKQNGAGSVAAQHAFSVEQQVFRHARKVVVTTPMMASDIARRIPEVVGHIVIIPNYVDIDLFHPINNMPIDYDIAFIGRLTDQKNVAALLKAIRPLGLKTLVIGDGELRISLQQHFQNLDPPVGWIPHVPNQQLPEYLARSRLFVLPSHYEGHPKTLIEAMACGLAVIGTDAPGIRELIQHGENGWLCGTDPQSIRVAIQHLLADPSLREKLGRNARLFVEKNYSLDKIVEMEYSLLQIIVNGAS